MAYAERIDGKLTGKWVARACAPQAVRRVLQARVRSKREAENGHHRSLLIFHAQRARCFAGSSRTLKNIAKLTPTRISPSKTKRKETQRKSKSKTVKSTRTSKSTAGRTARHSKKERRSAYICVE